MLIVDRIEDGFATLEGVAGSFAVPAGWLPERSREGTVLRFAVERDGERSEVVLALDPDGQAAREAAIQRLRDSIPEGPGGDLVL